MNENINHKKRPKFPKESCVTEFSGIAETFSSPYKGVREERVPLQSIFGRVDKLATKSTLTNKLSPVILTE